LHHEGKAKAVEVVLPPRRKAGGGGGVFEGSDDDAAADAIANAVAATRAQCERVAAGIDGLRADAAAAAAQRARDAAALVDGNLVAIAAVRARRAQLQAAAAAARAWPADRRRAEATLKAAGLDLSGAASKA
jgi:hypothetical protein